MRAGNENERVDARKLAELLRTGLLSPVYHGESGVRTLRELARSYLTIRKDLTRIIDLTVSSGTLSLKNGSYALSDNPKKL